MYHGHVQPLYQTVTEFLHHSPLPALPPSNHSSSTNYHQHFQSHGVTGSDSNDFDGGRSTSGSAGSSVILFETRQTNREVRLQLTDVLLKLDRVLAKVDEIRDENSGTDVALRSSSLVLANASGLEPTQSVFQLTRENKELKSKLAEVAIQLSSCQENASRLLDSNQRLLDQNVELVGRSLDTPSVSIKELPTSQEASAAQVEEVNVLKVELASMRVRETECQKQIEKLIRMDQENKQELQKIDGQLTDFVTTVERLNSELSEEKRSRREAEMTSRTRASDVEVAESRNATLQKALADAKNDSKLKISELENEMKTLQKTKQKELNDLMEKFRQQKSKAQEDLSELLRQTEESLTITWKRRVESLEKTLNDRHAMDVEELSAEKEFLAEKMISLEQKMAEVKRLRLVEEGEKVALRTELEENKNWKTKYDGLKSRAVSMKDKYERYITEMREEISLLEEKCERLTEKLDKSEEVAKGSTAKFEDLKVRAALERGELGKKSCELQVELISVKSEVDCVTKQRFHAQAELEKAQAENRLLMENIKILEKRQKLDDNLRIQTLVQLGKTSTRQTGDGNGWKGGVGGGGGGEGRGGGGRGGELSYPSDKDNLDGSQRTLQSDRKGSHISGEEEPEEHTSKEQEQEQEEERHRQKDLVGSEINDDDDDDDDSFMTAASDNEDDYLRLNLVPVEDFTRFVDSLSMVDQYVGCPSRQIGLETVTDVNPEGNLITKEFNIVNNADEISNQEAEKEDCFQNYNEEKCSLCPNKELLPPFYLGNERGYDDQVALLSTPENLLFKASDYDLNDASHVKALNMTLPWKKTEKSDDDTDNSRRSYSDAYEQDQDRKAQDRKAQDRKGQDQKDQDRQRNENATIKLARNVESDLESHVTNNIEEHSPCDYIDRLTLSKVPSVEKEPSAIQVSVIPPTLDIASADFHEIERGLEIGTKESSSEHEDPELGHSDCTLEKDPTPVETGIDGNDDADMEGSHTGGNDDEDMEGKEITSKLETRNLRTSLGNESDDLEEEKSSDVCILPSDVGPTPKFKHEAEKWSNDLNDPAFIVTCGGQIVPGWINDESPPPGVASYLPPEIDVQYPFEIPKYDDFLGIPDAAQRILSAAEDGHRWYQDPDDKRREISDSSSDSSSRKTEDAATRVGACVMLDDEDIRMILEKRRNSSIILKD